MKKILLAVGCCAAKLLVGAVMDGVPFVESAAQASEQVDSLFAEKGAAEITGDELIAALRNLSDESISSNVWHEVHRRLAGRELSFSDLTLSGFDWISGVQDRSRVNLAPCPPNEMFDVMRRGITLRVSLPTTVSERIGWMQSRDAVRSVVGTVLAPDEVKLGGFYGLHLRGTKLKPADAPPPPLPDFNAATITGNEVLSLLVGLPRRMVYVEELQRKLAGRELTFTNLVVVTGVWLRKGAGCDILLGEKKDEFRLMASFPTSFVDRVSWLEKGDRIARLTGRIPTLPRENGGIGLFLEGLDIVIETPKPKTISELIDLAKASGDDLLAYAAPLRKSQLNDLERSLAGRELTFHNLAIVEKSAQLNGRRTYALVPKDRKYAYAALRVRVKFDDPNLDRQADGLWNWGSWANNCIRELKGRVEFTENDAGFRATMELPITGTEIVLEKPFETIPDFDAKTITGDGVVKVAQSFKRGCGPYMSAIAERLVGRTLTFTNAVVNGVSYEDDGKALISFRIENKIPLEAGSWRTDSLILLTKVSAAELDELPWGLSSNDRTPRISGRVGTMPGNEYGFSRQGIFLEDAAFEVPWKNEKLPHFDAKTITGDEFVRMAAGFEPATRQAKIQRMLKMMKGRRLSFSQCMVARGERCEPSPQDGKIRVNLDFGTTSYDWNDASKCLIPVIFAGRSMDRVLRELAVGVQLTNVSGVVTWADHQPSEDKHGDKGFRLANVDYQLVHPAEDLPDFDAATITGDELADLIVRRKTALPPLQFDALWRKLDGRRLTFTKVEVSGCAYDDGFAHSLSFRFKGAPSSLRPDCEIPVSLKTPLTEAEVQQLMYGRWREGSAFCVTTTVNARLKERQRALGRFLPCHFLFADGVIDRVDAVK